MTETVDHPPAAPDLDRAPSTETPDAVENSVETYLAPLPPEMQELFRGFFTEVAKTVVSQHTRALPGDEIEVRVRPHDVTFYNDRIAEIRDTLFFNPHLPVHRHIT